MRAATAGATRGALALLLLALPCRAAQDAGAERPPPGSDAPVDTAAQELDGEPSAPADAEPLVIDELLPNPGMDLAAAGWDFQHAARSRLAGQDGEMVATEGRDPDDPHPDSRVSAWVARPPPGAHLRGSVRAMGTVRGQTARLAVSAVLRHEGRSLLLATGSDEAELEPGRWTELGCELQIPTPTDLVQFVASTTSDAHVIFDDASLRYAHSAPVARDPALAESLPLAGWPERVEAAVQTVQDLRGREFERMPAAGVVPRVRFAEAVLPVSLSMPRAPLPASFALLGVVEPGRDLAAALREHLREELPSVFSAVLQGVFVAGDTPRAAVDAALLHGFARALDRQLAPGGGPARDLSLHDEDGWLAAAALEEGTATFVVQRGLVQRLASGAGDARDALEVLGATAMARVATRERPAYLAVKAWMPPAAGLAFLEAGVERRRELSFVEVLDAAWADPPRTVEQILHPRKYWDADALDTPRSPPALALDAALGEGWRSRGAGTFGEALLALATGHEPPVARDVDAALTTRWTHAPSEGWDGDRWQLYQAPGGRAALLLTHWDSRRDADEFAAALPSGPRLIVDGTVDMVLVSAADDPADAEHLLSAAHTALPR